MPVSLVSITKTPLTRSSSASAAWSSIRRRSTISPRSDSPRATSTYSVNATPPSWSSPGGDYLLPSNLSAWRASSTGTTTGHRLRISDADRHRVAELLREAAGEGRLDIDELDERLEAAYAAKTYGDLVPLTADLPLGAQHHPLAEAPPAGPPGVPAVRYDTSVAIMGGTSRKGVWEVGPTHTAVAIMGGVEIDLRQARFTSQGDRHPRLRHLVRHRHLRQRLHPGDRRRRRHHGGLRPGPRQGAARARTRLAAGPGDRASR